MQYGEMTCLGELPEAQNKSAESVSNPFAALHLTNGLFTLDALNFKLVALDFELSCLFQRRSPVVASGRGE